MENKILFWVMAGLIFVSCEKVKEEPLPTVSKKYPVGMSFATDVYPLLTKTCEACHTGDYSPASVAFNFFSGNGYNVLKSQPVTLITADSVKYWKEADSLLRISNFYTFANGSHKTKLDLTATEYDKIYGWIIAGGTNN